MLSLALNMSKATSSGKIRRRLDASGTDMRQHTEEFSRRLQERTEAPITTHQGNVPHPVA